VPVQVILKEIDGVICEPFENLSVDVESQHQGTVMEKLGAITNIS
jgi:GTP-binding protein